MLSVQKIEKSSAASPEGAVACARLESSRAALEMLEAGGNAIDAAVAAAFVAGVVEPMETTLAGSGFLLVHRPGSKHAEAFDFAPRAPRRAAADMFKIDTSRQVDRGLGVSVVVDDANIRGIRAAGVPAVVRGLTDAHSAYGRLPLAKVMSPAIHAAYNGFDVDSYFALEVLANLDGLRKDPGASAIFLRAGLPPVPAHIGSASLGVAPKVQQHALGRSLEIIAQSGAEAFYKGEIARNLLNTVQDLGGIIAEEDLLLQRTSVGPARSIVFRAAQVWVPNAPCGALTQLQMLKLWQAVYPRAPASEDSAERVRLFAAVTRHSFADRYYWLGDPEFVKVPERGLMSNEYADAVAAEIAKAGCPSWRELPQAPWDHFAGHMLHDPWPFEGGTGNAWTPGGATEPRSGTTHVSVIDREGMAVAITHTAANHFGANVVCPRTGFQFDAAMGWFNARPGAANSIAPGKRPLANMGPMLLTRGRTAFAALGAPGGRRIISAIAQIAINLVERGHDAQQALAAPRYDASGTVVLLSERLQELVGQLESGGEIVRTVSEQHEGYGYELARPNIVVRHPDGRAEAACDPYSKGYAAAL